MNNCEKALAKFKIYHYYCKTMHINKTCLLYKIYLSNFKICYYTQQWVAVNLFLYTRELIIKISPEINIVLKKTHLESYSKMIP